MKKIEKFGFFSNVTKSHQMVGNGHKSGPEYILGSAMDSNLVLWVQIRCWGIVCGWPGQVPRKGGAPQGSRRGPLTQTTFTKGGSIGI